MSYFLHTHPGNYRALKALITAQYNGVELETNPDFEFGKDNKSASFLVKNPLGKVPVLDTPQGPIFESNAIARYVAGLNESTNLLGKSFYERAIVNQWIDFASFEVAPPSNIWIYPILGYLKYDETANKRARADVEKVFKIMDEHLIFNTYFVGDYITLADIIIFCNIKGLYDLVLTKDAREQYPRVLRWFTTLVNQPEFIAVIGEFKFTDKESLPSGVSQPKAETKAAKKEVKKDVVKEKAPEATAAPEKKEKPKNPLDLLPPSPMILDNVKRLFSNESFESAFEKFAAEFDSEGWALWEGAYNYNNENTVLFMTCNLIGGYIQRLESFRKYGFGALNVSGEEDGPFDISCLFLARGKDEMPEELKGCSDSEYYTWKKIALDDAGKKRIAELWNAEVVDGKPLQERRFFK